MIKDGDVRRPRRVALTLLRDLARQYRPADESLLEYVYTEVLVAEGLVHKTTKPGRFVELDDKIASDILARFGHRHSIAVHDLGASSGITSVGLFRILEKRCAQASGQENRGRVRLVASDLYDSLYIVEVRNAAFTVVFGSDRQPMQYVGRGFVLTAHAGKYQEGPWYPVNRALKRWLDHSLLPRARRLLEGQSVEGLQGEIECGEGRVTRVPLVHPECVRLMATNPAFSFRRHDLFVPSVEAYQVVRAMNVLNRGYFAEEQLRVGVRAILASLEEGGLFVVGRSVTDGAERTRATAFVRSSGRFVPAWHLHDGCEISELVCGVEDQTAPPSQSWALA